jgi:hypothetical protein
MTVRPHQALGYLTPLSSPPNPILSEKNRGVSNLLGESLVRSPRTTLALLIHVVESCTERRLSWVIYEGHAPKRAKRLASV